MSFLKRRQNENECADILKSLRVFFQRNLTKYELIAINHDYLHELVLVAHTSGFQFPLLIGVETIHFPIGSHKCTLLVYVVSRKQSQNLQQNQNTLQTRRV